MKEFQINEFITLRLEDCRTVIYILGEPFLQCVQLLLNVPITLEVNNVTSIDAATETYEILEDELQVEDELQLIIPPDVEFWGHCSNLQVWSESKYNTRLIHRSIAFPLLKKSSEVGDLNARKIFKEEIGERFKEGSTSVRDYLIIEGYMRYLSVEELSVILPKEYTILKELGRELSNDFSIYTFDGEECFDIQKKQNQMVFFLNEELQINAILFAYCNYSYDTWDMIFKKLKSLKFLESLYISHCNLRRVPSSIRHLTCLKNLEIDESQVEILPKVINSLKNLENLRLKRNKILYLPDSIGDLKALTSFDVSENQLEKLPNTIGNLKSLTFLNLCENNLSYIPSTIGFLKSLKSLLLTDNKLTKLPNEMVNCRNLRRIFLRNNNISNCAVLKRLKIMTYPKIFL